MNKSLGAQSASWQTSTAKRKFYVTTAIPYVNAKPHVGHALEFVQSDVISRYHKELLSEKTILLSGGDENALKNVQAAEKEGIPIQEFVDKNSKLFQDLAGKLNIQFDVFQKSSTQTHHESSRKLWELCSRNGDIYKEKYIGLYCVGCEAFYERDELDGNGQCHEHPGTPLQEVSENNYFFKLSKYQKEIEKLIESDALKIIPESRKNEALSFVKSGLKDISISRSNKRAKNWGVSVPGDNDQKMYVWFDALNIYQSGVGFGYDEAKYQEFWPANVHMIGKGILRFHAVYWPAFLLSAGLKLPKELFVHGYFTVDGEKMSKSLGNVVDPIGLTEKYGTDALRYYLLSQIPSTGDGDFSEDRLRETYNSDLSNGLGNLVSRVAALFEQKKLSSSFSKINGQNTLLDNIKLDLNLYKFNEALEKIWGSIRELDRYINKERPWQQELPVVTQTLSNIVVGAEGITSILEIADALKPFLPETSEKIITHFSKKQITAISPLFPRL